MVELEKWLRLRGLNEYTSRPGWITLCRVSSSFRFPFWRQDTNGVNRCTLLELLAEIYVNDSQWPALHWPDLAGVRPDEVEITIRGREVTISGLRRDHAVEEGCCHYRMEISYSRFERTIELPSDLGPATLQYEFRDGMLLIRIRRRSPNS